MHSTERCSGALDGFKSQYRLAVCFPLENHRVALKTWNWTSHEEALSTLSELSRGFRFDCIGMDPWCSRQLMLDVKNLGIDVVEMIPSKSSSYEWFNSFYCALANGRIEHEAKITDILVAMRAFALSQRSDRERVARRTIDRLRAIAEQLEAELRTLMQ